MSITLAVLVSGRGSNLEAILRAIKANQLDARVSIVISNKPGVRALEIANRFNVPSAVVDGAGLSRSDHEALLLKELAEHKFDYLMLAGYMKVLTLDFLRHFKSPSGYFHVINIHPSLLPSFPGATPYEDAFAAGITESGVTIHLVDEIVDHGTVLAQAKFSRLPGDTLDEFKARGLALEHKLLPETLQKLALGKLNLPSITKARG